MVTLGCARNEVDSEELAGRLEAGGFRLVEDPADAETVVVNTCGFVEAAKKDSVDTLLAAADLKGTDGLGRHGEHHEGGGRGRVPRRAVRRRAGHLAARGRRRARVRRLPRHRRPAALDPRRRGTAPAHAAGPAQAAPDLTGRPGRDHGLPAGPRRSAQARHRPDGAAEAGVGLRPALHLLRDPDLPRLVRLPSPLRRARRGALAGRPGCPRAVPGQRELHVLRQGPR